MCVKCEREAILSSALGGQWIEKRYINVVHLQCLKIVLYINITFGITYIMYCIVMHVISSSKAMLCV